MTKNWLTIALLGATGVALPACSGGTSSEEGGGSAAVMSLLELSNGFGQLLPHRIRELDAA